MNKNAFTKLKTKQFILDEVIKENHGLDGQILIQDKMVSLDVELSEFANEVRFFKFWSKKQMDYNKALVEYVDCLHFFLSIANDLGFEAIGVEYMEEEQHGNFTTDYLRCKKHVLDICTSTDMMFTFQLAFAWFWSMGKRCGFSEDEILQAYNEKNKINHERQSAGY